MDSCAVRSIGGHDDAGGDDDRTGCNRFAIRIPILVGWEVAIGTAVECLTRTGWPDEAIRWVVDRK